MTGPDPREGVEELAQRLLDLCMVELVESTGGQPARGYLHPGASVPDYLGDGAGCDFAAVRVVDIAPQPGTWTPPCHADIFQVTLEVKVMRCYLDSDPRKTAPDPLVLAGATRVALDDAAAVRRALCAMPDRPHGDVARWRPEGPQGGAYSGITTVTFTGLDLPCC
ncbi:hypothetical protein TPB0596_12480 [Tsukamurella pulmonis]|uniref:hypothetical protein n=1 Tax=Tsukamurella pulmonis TaxID=47312 RepID=UPI001EDD9684|nr:hypothetical protein [Tsukamurella pulmonis]BDD81485.1 hypothetical protein TPB0596_12480 [Tsukamurella pulmonis]